MTCSFVIETQSLLSNLLQLKKVERSAKKKTSVLELTVVDNELALVIPGIRLGVKAETTGSAKFSIRLWHFSDIISCITTELIRCTITTNCIEINSSRYNVYTTFFDNDTILRSIDLPVNFTQLDIFKLYLSGKFTPEEVEFNKLTNEVKDALNQVNADIDKVAVMIKKYGVKREDVSNLIISKIQIL